MNQKTTPITTVQKRYRGNKSDLITNVVKGLVTSKLKNLKYGHLQIHDAEGNYDLGRIGEAPQAEIIVHDPNFYIDVFSKGSIGAAESYVLGKWESSDLDQVMRLFALNRKILTDIDSGLVNLLKPVRFLDYWKQRNTVKGAKKNIEAHYDLPDKLFKLFLDETMMYSSAYFKEEGHTLKEAQTEKMKLIAERLNLTPNHHVLEIGTGWGALAKYLAENYGCHVTTTTISENQYKEAKRRIDQSSHRDKITLLKKDYRKLTGKFDRVVSIEMIEAVGEKFLGQYMETVSNLLKEDGRCLMQVITINDQEYERAVKEVDFIKKFIFPGSFIPSIHAILSEAKEKTDLRMYLQSDMTEHYVQTLKKWKQNFNRNREELTKEGLDEEFQRLWNFYFSYCIGGFWERAIGVSHLIFGKPLHRG